MDILLPLIFSVLSLFIMMIPGVILKKCRLVTDIFGKGVSNLVLYVAQPALIVFAYLDYKGEPTAIIANIIWVFLLSVVAHILFAVVALALFRKAEDGRRRMLRFATVFSNAAFMGIPLISEILGAEATIYASIYNITFNLFLWSLGVYFCTARRDEDGDGTLDGEDKSAIVKKNPISPLKVLLHPVNIASVIGLLCLLLSVRELLGGLFPMEGQPIDGLIVGSFEKLKHLVAPLSMVVIGLRIPEISFHGAFRDKYLYLFLALRHLVLPGAVLLMLWGFTAAGMPISREVGTVVLLLAATPAATSATMFAEKYDCDSVYTSRTVTISTLLSVATMPLIIFLYGILV